MKAVIFDVDGVLVDDMALHAKAYKEVLKREKGIEITKQDVYALSGRGARGVIDLLTHHTLPADELKRLRQLKTDLFIEYTKAGFKLIPGTKKFLAKLKKHGIRMGVSTATVWPHLNRIFDSTGIRDYFGAVTTEEDVKQAKPDPAIFLDTAKKLGVAPKDCVVIEDAPLGIEAAKKAGMKVIAVTYTGVFPKERLKDADLIVRTLDEVDLDKMMREW